VLAAGEPGVDTTTGEQRIGDGVSTWSALLGVGVSGQSGRLMSTLRRGRQDAVLAVLGDSTGNETTEWVYGLTTWIAQQFPAYTVTYRLWNDAGQAYDSPVTIQTGTGSKSLTVYNGSVPGAGYNYPFASAVKTDRFFAMLPVAPTAVVVSFGYNSSQSTYRASHLELAGWVLGNYPNAEYVVTSQPPMATTATDAANHLARQQDARDVAAREGFGLIDVTQRFIDFGDYDAIINADKIHPLAAGSALWLDEAKRYFGRNAQRQQPRTAPAAVTRIFVPAQAFSVYAGTPTITFPSGVITPKWDMDPTTEEMIATIVDIPPQWAAVDVDLVWGSPVTTSGAVVWQVDSYSLTLAMVPQSGKPLNGATAGTPVTVTAVSNAARVTRVFAAERFVGGRPVAFRVRRIAANAADTSTQDHFVFGLMISRSE